MLLDLGDSSYLVADYLLLLLVVESGHRKAALIFRVDLEIDISEVGIVRVYRIWCDIIPRKLLVFRRKSPTFEDVS